jgi:hypothetical protein
MYLIVDVYSMRNSLHTRRLMLTIKSQHSIAMQIMISTICMLHTIVMQVLSKNSHTTSGICNTNYKVAFCCVPANTSAWSLYMASPEVVP